MNFQTLPVVDAPQDYLDQAIKHAAKQASEFKRKLRKGEALDRQVKAEQQRLKKMAEALGKSLSRIPKEFPNLEALPELYQHLLQATLDPERLRGGLASVATAVKNVRQLANDFARQYSRAGSKDRLLSLKRQAIGRISSVVKRLEKDLRYLEQSRKIMKGYPAIKPDLFTVAIAGFPNVGKSTLLNKLTGSKAETKAYAFTTKTLNAGSFVYRHNTIQCIDTPGTLARPEKMNPIEQQAYLAMKYAAHVIIYIYDLTEPYPLEDQERLEKELKKYGKDIILYLSKTDILDEEIVKKFTRQACTSADDVKKEITKLFESDFL